MSADATIVDYGSGNILSVRRALEQCGATVVIAKTPAEIAGAKRLIVPGVGAFGDCMTALRKAGFDAAITGYAQDKKPLLGICVGMQILFEVSEEFGEHRGLALIAGEVQRIPNASEASASYKIPHIGWSDLQATQAWDTSILAGLNPGSAVYFVHSYVAKPADPAATLAVCHYGGHELTAAVRQGNTFGVQFHPEKSGNIGLQVLRNFLQCPVGSTAYD